MAKDGWLKLKDAPLDTPGLVWCPAKAWGNRTDSVGVVHQYASGERFAAGSFHGFEITHWHPVPAPPAHVASKGA